MADRYAHGFRSATAAAKRLINDMADQNDTRTSDDAFAGRPPSESVRRLRQAAMAVGALQPPGRSSASGVPITKGKPNVER